MRVNERRCDRCGTKLDPTVGLEVVVRYHHPSTLELCEECEVAFTLWLGKHPLWGTPVNDEARRTGRGWPTPAQVVAHRQAAARA